MTEPILREKPLRVLVVDDSAFNRRNISEILSSSRDVEVIGKAADGEEALRLVTQLKPDVITLDLEMPKMDGFTFLRIMMSKLPTPVIVVSSYSQKENVFKALELGALDFVAKPDRYADADLSGIRDELLEKVLLARSLRTANLFVPQQQRPAMESIAGISEPPRAPVTTITAARNIVAIASSTGGPTALMEIFARLPERSQSAMLIAQHMPDKFTRTFAERLNKRSNLRVTEAQDMDQVGQGFAFVCPGRRCMEVEVMPSGNTRLRVVAPSEADRYVPSADRLFASVAKVAGARAVGVILTGMGDDGVQGARSILDAGGTVIAESERTAVVYGMPGAAVRAKVVTRSLALPEIGDYLADLAS